MFNAIMIDKRIERFVEATVMGEKEEILTIRLKDIGETFWFDKEAEAQNFINKQVTERVGARELRKGYFDYTDEHKEVHRYYIEELHRGEVLSFREEMVA